MVFSQQDSLIMENNPEQPVMKEPVPSEPLPPEQAPLTQAYLETLTTRELIKLADLHGVDIPRGLDRIFIIEELLELAAYDTEIEEEYTEIPQARVIESAVLPKKYNITFLEILVRDPLWVYVYWEIKSSDREIFDKAPDFGGYFLRISPLGRIAPDEIFTVPLAQDDNARYLGFPPSDGLAEGTRQCYRVELFASRGSENILLAASDQFSLPMLAQRIDKNEKIDHNPLINLSGEKDFHILRNGDRQFRAKKNGNSVRINSGGTNSGGTYPAGKKIIGADSGAI